jgi:porin
LHAVCSGGEEPQRQGKAGYGKRPRLGGPSSVQAMLEEDDETKDPAFRLPFFDNMLKPWFDFKSKVNERIGLQFGVNYTALYQNATDAPSGAEDDAAVGIARLFGRWQLLGRDTKNTGTLVFSVDHRHRLGTDIAPADLGFETGYLGIPGTLFSDARWVLVDLNWQQYINDGQTGIIIGRYDPNDYFDVLGYANPWTTFQNLAILFNTSIALPDASYGVGVGQWLTGQVWVGATLNDANGVVTETEFFDGGAEFYKAAEIGWTPSRDERYLKKTGIMVWHVDERDDAGVPDSWGVTATANWTWDKTWMVFGKAGWSDGDAPLMNASATAGVLYYLASRSDLIGLATNWGDPADDSLDDQVTTELFYRLQLAQNLAVTPSVQLLVDPALNPDEDTIGIFGMRVRFTF